ncbi:hypothetical protein Y032_0353g3302 [Ancylostoma ceylanicum]|uniref:Uncharacterized protein n=1 Tax=Ancylostoma ceylanicum TaxID=53326 RepID=A0A016RWE6_9BILA|nr:hypothetical protein Y032_0353g3302 [Ancylostoma ceylanicum]
MNTYFESNIQKQPRNQTVHVDCPKKSERIKCSLQLLTHSGVERYTWSGAIGDWSIRPIRQSESQSAPPTPGITPHTHTF